MKIKNKKINNMNNNNLICFSAGTSVLTKNGKEKDIENIKVGESILSYNINKKIVESVIVEKTATSIHSNVNK